MLFPSCFGLFFCLIFVPYAELVSAASLAAMPRSVAGLAAGWTPGRAAEPAEPARLVAPGWAPLAPPGARLTPPTLLPSAGLAPGFDVNLGATAARPPAQDQGCTVLVGLRYLPRDLLRHANQMSTAFASLPLVLMKGV